MTPQELWERYAAIWSSDAATRESELAVCLADDATYRDPNGVVHGRAALSTYMGAFQESVPQARFQIDALHYHHDRTLALWSLRGPANTVLQNGTSFAVLAEDGRLREITGFFPTGD